MKKRSRKFAAALTLALAMMVGLTACGGGGGEGGAEGGKPDDAAAEVKLETYDTGTFTVGVPEGYFVEHAKFAADDPDPNNISVIKGDKDADPLELVDVPRINIIYAPNHDRFYGDDMEAFKKATFEDAADIDPAIMEKLQNYNWTGFKGTDLYGGEYLLGKDGDEEQFCWEVYVRTTNAMGDVINSIEKPEVQAIVNSLKPN